MPAGTRGDSASVTGTRYKTVSKDMGASLCAGDPATPRSPARSALPRHVLCDTAMINIDITICSCQSVRVNMFSR